MSRLLVAVLFAITFAALGVERASAQTDFSDSIRLGVGDVTRAEGVIARGDSVISFPFEYRRTGILQNDVRGNGRNALGTLYAAAGTPGYLLGSYRMGQRDVGTPVWCFFRPEQINIENIICFFGGYQGVSTVLDFAGRPLLLSRFEMNMNRNRTSDAPIVEEGPVTLPFPLRATYRFVAWRGDTVVLDISNGEHDIGRYYVEPNARGETVLRTVAGAVRFTRDDQRQTIVAQVADDREQVNALATILGATGALTVETVLSVLDAPEAHDFQPVARDQEVFTQRVRPMSAMRQETSPNNNDVYGEPGALLVSAMRGLHPIMCWRAYPHRYLEWSMRTQANCLEDGDRDGAYETLWPYVTYRDSESFFISSINGPSERVRTPVRLTDAPDATLPESTITLRYVGPVRERRAASGALEAAAVGFSWRLGRALDPQVIEVELGANGEGALMFAGRELGRVRAVNVVSGAAEFQLISGLPVGGPAFVSGRTSPATE